MFSLTLRPLLFSLVGTLSIVFAITLLWVISAYHEFALQARLDSRAEVVETAIRQQLSVSHEPLALELARIGASLPLWPESVDELDEPTIQSALDEAIGQQLFTTGEIQLRGIVLLSRDMDPLATRALDGKADAVWSEWRKELKLRKGVDARRVVGRYTLDSSGGTVHVLVHPIGSLRLAGYLAVVTEPTKALPGVTAFIDGRVTIETTAGEIVLEEQPENWRRDVTAESSVPGDVETVSTTIHSKEGLPIYRVTVRSKDRGFAEEAAWLRKISYLVAGFVTVGALVAAAVILQATVFHRVKAVSHALQRIVSGDTSLSLPEAGADEIGTMICDLHKVANYVDRVVSLKAELAQKNLLLESQVNQRQQAEARIEFLAHHDELTGLPNRALFHERINTALAGCRRDEAKVAVLLLDLDRFKQVNDTLGHQAGDMLLQQVALRLQGLVRVSDTVARLGGDEFIIALIDFSSSEHCRHLAQRILDALSAPFDLAGRSALIGVSVGIAISGIAGDNAERLMSSADLALYRAKNMGRGQYCFFDLAMDAQQRARRQMESDLREGLEHDSFVLHYQPQVRVAGNEIELCGIEALVRWQCAKRGLVSPGEFIGLAEDCGLIQEIGDWVIRQACMDAAALQLNTPVAVNLSPLQLKKSRLVDKVKQALVEADLPPSRLVLEITETVLLDDTDFVLHQLHALKKLGVRIAMDDFGTGYSSLRNLRLFAFDSIKIDRSFLSDRKTLKENRPIIEAILNLGLSFGSQVIAEGVETEEQMNYLLALGCSDLQGYLFSEPVSLADLGTKVPLIALSKPRIEAAMRRAPVPDDCG